MSNAAPNYPPIILPRPSLWASVFRFLMGTAFGISVGLNLLFLLAISSVYMLQGGTTEDDDLRERLHGGEKASTNKIAIVQLNGVIVEGMLDYVRKQIETAAKDPKVKSVVLRINSPGGSITASDELFHRITQLRDGDLQQSCAAKPIVVSMGSLAASGGYYIAMPSKHLVAERSTITGSIGVYAAFPNVTELAQKWGVKMEVIKRGEVKDSGSMFRDMTPRERQVWDDLIDHAFDQFLTVVREGRGDKLKFDLREPIPAEERDAGKPGEVPERFERRLADGGVFTSDRAMQYGLIDQIGFLEDAVEVAARQAHLGTDYKVVTYERPRSFLMNLLGVEASAPAFDVANSAMPRVWYLAPESGLSGVLAAAGVK
jgi:protease-4